MKHFKKLVALGLSIIMAFSVVGCSQNKKEEAGSSEAKVLKIGIMSHNVQSNEPTMFRNYLKNYLGDIFDVEFCVSDSITCLEDEKDFIDKAKKAGCKGVISFMSYDLKAIVDYCGSDMYFALQNMTPTDEEFEALANKPQFLGVVSPSNEAEYNAGANIAKSFLKESRDSSKTWLVFSGGAQYGNNMHVQRFKGIADVLTASGYSFDDTMDKLLTVKTPMKIGSGKDGGEVYLCPGYPSTYKENVDQALSMCDADYLVSCATLEYNEKQISDYKKRVAKKVEVGLIDCFSEQAADSFSNGSINYITGKYAPMVVPSFIAMVNALYGHSDLVKKNGKAYWINQDMWSADSKDEFFTKYSDSINVYSNMYSARELQNLVASYNKAVTYDDFIKKMTEK